MYNIDAILLLFLPSSQPSSYPIPIIIASFCKPPLQREHVYRSSTWLMYWRMLLYQSDDHQVEMLYETILPHICGRSVYAAIDTQDAGSIYRTGQRSGSCYFRCVTECARYILHCHGVCTLPHFYGHIIYTCY